MYPSAPLLLVQETAVRFPGLRVATHTPTDLRQVCAVAPFARIQRTGGPRRYTIDRPSIDVDVWATSLAAADEECGQITAAWEFALPGKLIDAGAAGRAVVARVEVTSGPSERPTSDTTLSRVGASLAVWLHARPVA